MWACRWWLWTRPWWLCRPWWLWSRPWWLLLNLLMACLWRLSQRSISRLRLRKTCPGGYRLGLLSSPCQLCSRTLCWRLLKYPDPVTVFPDTQYNIWFWRCSTRWTWQCVSYRSGGLPKVCKSFFSAEYILLWFLLLLEGIIYLKSSYIQFSTCLVAYYRRGIFAAGMFLFLGCGLGKFLNPLCDNKKHAERTSD